MAHLTGSFTWKAVRNIPTNVMQRSLLKGLALKDRHQEIAFAATPRRIW